MNQQSQLPRKDGRSQPKIEEPDEQNLDYSDIASNPDETPSTGGFPEKDSPEDLDHPDIGDSTSSPPVHESWVTDRHVLHEEREITPRPEIEVEQDEEFPLDPDPDRELDLPSKDQESWTRQKPVPSTDEPEEDKEDSDATDPESV